MKKFFIKSTAVIMMCVIVFSSVVITVSAGTIVPYFGSCGNYFSCALKGRMETEIGASRVIAKTTRLSGGSNYTYTYVKVYFEYPDGEYYPEWNVTTLDTTMVSLDDPGYIYAPDGISSLHTIYSGENISDIASTPGSVWLGDHSH